MNNSVNAEQIVPPWQIVSPPPSMPRNETPVERRERRAREADEKRAKEAEQGISRRPHGRAMGGQEWDEQLGDWVPMSSGD